MSGRLKEENAALKRDLHDALEQQTATSEVLSVISSSPGELEPVFQTMLANATRICEANFGTLYYFQDSAFHLATSLGAAPALAEFYRQRGSFQPPPGTPLDRLLQTKEVIHIADDAAELNPGAAARLGGARSTIAVPMLKDNELIGAIVIYRQEVRPFTGKQIELVQNFAAQAVIAIENTRLLKELRQRTDDLSEALEQQTATSEVLKVISSSPGDLEPVFRTMLENVVRICEAKFGNLALLEGDRLRVVSLFGAPPAFEELRHRDPFNPIAQTPLGRILETKQVHAIADLTAQEPYASSPLVKLAGARAFVGVPLLKESKLIGILSIYREEVRPFSDKQIDLVANFAAQAVIAIENTRLLSELRQRTDDLSESLEQQTATSDVLRVISSSPGELEPVFQAMLQKATQICEAKIGILFRYENGAYSAISKLGVTAEYAEFLNRGPIRPGPATGLGRVASTKQTVHIEDTKAEQAYADREPFRIATTELGRARTLLNVPMLKDGELIGAIGVYRQTVRPFTDKQIELVTNFAAQAVIAIENTRLLSELRQSLQQQTATADVLKVISRSTFDLQTVLNTLVESAARLCQADRTAIRIAKDGLYHHLADYGFVPGEGRERMRQNPVGLTRGSMAGRVVLEGKAVHLVDTQADTEEEMVRLGKLSHTRTLLGVPLMREGAPIGVLLLQRSIVQPFTDKQIELANTFADQAVIAIENTRLLSELRESLQQQTATSEVLKVISRSAFDLQPVFDTMAESVVRLCEAERAFIFRFDGQCLRSVATYNVGPEYKEWVSQHPIPLGQQTISARAALEKRTVQVTDVQADPDYKYGMRDGDLIRTTLAVPMLKGDQLIGTITIYRLEVKPFTEKQVALVETFADQAVIAIENVRLFDEIQEKSRQLAEASQHKSQFLANMSHELRTPLNAIIGYTELIIDGIYGETPDKAQAVLKRVESNGRHLLGLINDVLDFSKIEAGQLKLSISEYSMKDVVHNVYSAVEPLAAKKHLKFKVDVPPDMPAGHGDERKLTQVLLNLVGNAIKFTDAGEVVIKVAPGNGAFSVAVHDTGPGIPLAAQDKLFEEFQQADNSITKAKGGTGLGLAISRRIIEMHGGRLWVDSSAGNGSIFTFEIPSVVEPARPP